MYQLSSPAPALSPFIEHYWFVSATEARPFDLRVDVYVDARADLVFNFGAPYTRTVLDGRTAPLEQLASNLDAQRTRPIRIAQRGAVEIVGVRFRTAGLSPFVSQPVDGWTDRVVPLDEAFGADGPAVEAALRAASSREARTELLDAFFGARLAQTPAHATVQALMTRIERAGGDVRMADLSAEGRVPIRKLDRWFLRHLGFSPKAFARIVRFQRALTMLKTDPGCTLAAVGAACGYYDQPHFVRDFKQYAGVAPSARVGYFPADGPDDFSPNVVQFVQDQGGAPGDLAGRDARDVPDGAARTPGDPR